jgi:hypothetical protein
MLLCPAEHVVSERDVKAGLIQARFTRSAPRDQAIVSNSCEHRLRLDRARAAYRRARRDVGAFVLPFAIAPFTISMLWHPRMDGELAHRWLRSFLAYVLPELAEIPTIERAFSADGKPPKVGRHQPRQVWRASTNDVLLLA